MTYSTIAYGKNDLGDLFQGFGNSAPTNEPAPFAPFDSMVPKDAPSLEMLELLTQGGLDKLPPNVRDFLMKNKGSEPLPILVSPPQITNERTIYSDKTSMNAQVPKPKVPSIRDPLVFGAIIPGMEPIFRPTMNFDQLLTPPSFNMVKPKIGRAEKVQTPQEPHAGKKTSPLPISGKEIELNSAEGKSFEKSKKDQENQITEKKEQIPPQVEENTALATKLSPSTNDHVPKKSGAPEESDIEANTNATDIKTLDVNAMGTNTLTTDETGINTTKTKEINTDERSTKEASTDEIKTEINDISIKTGEKNQELHKRDSNILLTQSREYQEEKSQNSLGKEAFSNDFSKEFSKDGFDKDTLSKNELVKTELAKEDLAHILNKLSLNDLNLRAEAGDASAQYKLGLKYYDGIDMEKNQSEAIRWIKKSAIAGHLPAMIGMGKLLEEGTGTHINLKGAVSWYAQAADKGFADGFFHLALLYDTGKLGTGKSAKRFAMDYYKQAAKLNHPKALYNLALFYDTNQGTTEDIKQAVQLYRDSAKLGDARAQLQVGLLYESGKYLPKDDALASQWYSKAAMQGLPEAQYLLAGMYQQGKGIPKDLGKAIQLYEAAAEQGFVGAQSTYEPLPISSDDSALNKNKKGMITPNMGR